MKKFLAVLLVALVALTSVFAGARTLTLTNTVDDVPASFEVFYGDKENPTNKLEDQHNDTVDSLESGKRYFEVKFSANSASDKDSGLSVTFNNGPFVHTSTNANDAKDNMKVDTTLTFESVAADGTVTTIENNKVNVTYAKYNKIDNALVAKGTLSWSNDKDLVAGDYKCIVTVLISTND